MSVDADLQRFADLLVKWNTAQNLVSRETIGELWPRHIADSVQLTLFLRDSDRHVLDIGSGGGFPALPLAIATRGRGLSFDLVEPIAKKGAFLRTVARELDLPVQVHTMRIAQFDSRETVDVITARALAPLLDLFQMMQRFASPKTRFLLHKGRNYRAEVDSAAAHFDFDMLSHPSTTDAEGVILEISNLRAKSAT